MKFKAMFVVTFLCLSTVQVNAQIMSPISSGTQMVYLQFGLDPAVLTTIGYARGNTSNLLGRDFIVSAELGLPVAQLDLHDYRVKIGAQTSVVNYKGWDFSIPVHVILRGTRNWMHNATSLGGDLAALIGYYGTRWFTGLEFGYDTALMTKLTATDRYKKYYYQDFRDGWYGNTSHFFTRGIRAGFRLNKTELILRAGQPIMSWKAESNELTPPFFVNLGVNYHFTN